MIIVLTLQQKMEALSHWKFHNCSRRKGTPKTITDTQDQLLSYSLTGIQAQKQICVCLSETEDGKHSYQVNQKTKVILISGVKAKNGGELSINKRSRHFW